jgi:uncharacterized membrane protein YoaK (UPF0700 family)
MLDTRRNIMLACALSALAGYVDGIGFLHLGGLFVSFMSGNSTRMGVSLAEGHWQEVASAAGLIALFVLGATCGSLLMRLRGGNRQSRLLFVEGALLIAATVCHLAAFPRSAVACMVLAMGSENAAFQVKGGSGLGLTYMTGALVRIGQQIASALTGGGPWFAWAPNLLLWAALVVGAALGAWAYLQISLMAVWISGAFALLLSVFAAATEDAEH